MAVDSDLAQGHLFEEMPVAFVGSDAGGVLRVWNHEAERVSGHLRDELLGNPRALDLLGDDGELQRLLELARTGAPVRDVRSTLRRPDGELRIVSWSSRAREVAVPGLASWLMGVDVTERDQIQERLVLAERMASVGALAAGVAHEINNPLTYLLANLVLLDRALAGPTPPATARKLDLRELVAEAREGAERVTQIVRDLHMFARADDDRDQLVDVQRCLEACLQMMANELRHRARVVRDLRPVPPVRANDARLGQVFLNLLVNAAHALPEGREAVNEVRLASWTDDKGQAIVEVADNGSGIAPAALRHVFDPFFTTRPVGVGTGLGLAVAHRIVTGFGGDIAVTSEEGRGSTFRVTLPAGRASSSPPAIAPAARAPARRGRVLVVDDEELVGRVIRRALSVAHDVIVTTSAAQALAALDAGPPFDLILCDVMLPETSGVDLHAKLAEKDAEHARRMVFMSGGAFTARARKFLAEIPNPRLEKPFDPALLVELVGEWLAAFSI